jgi:hypothetical protein
MKAESITTEQVKSAIRDIKRRGIKPDPTPLDETIKRQLLTTRKVHTMNAYAIVDISGKVDVHKISVPVSEADAPETYIADPAPDPLWKQGVKEADALLNIPARTIALRKMNAYQKSQLTLCDPLPSDAVVYLDSRLPVPRNPSRS